MLCQAAVAIFELVESGKLDNPQQARDAITGALNHIAGFKTGHPDRNTLEILQSALAKIG